MITPWPLTISATIYFFSTSATIYIGLYARYFCNEKNHYMSKAYEQSTFLKGEMSFMGRCPVCKAAFSADQTSVIQRTDRFSLFHVDCQRCKSSSLITITPGPMQLVTSMVMLTDLHKDDMPKVLKAQLLTSDDVLAVHAHFKTTVHLDKTFVKTHKTFKTLKKQPQQHL